MNPGSGGGGYYTQPTTGAGAPGSAPGLNVPGPGQPGYYGQATMTPNAQGQYTNPNGTMSQYDPYNNYGDSGMPYDVYTREYGTPDQQAAAGSAEGAASYATGVAAANNPAVNPTLQPPAPGVLSGPGYGEKEFADHGNDLNGPTNTQTLFNEGLSYSSPFYQQAMDNTNRALIAHAAANGTANSTGTMDAMALADANLTGQQVAAEYGLAGQADSAKQGAYTATMNAANNAENQTNQRVQQITNGQVQLSTAESNVVSNFYQMAQQGQLTGDMASIEAQIQASGVDAATAQAIANDLLQVGGIAAKYSSSSSSSGK